MSSKLKKVKYCPGREAAFKAWGKLYETNQLLEKQLSRLKAGKDDYIFLLNQAKKAAQDGLSELEDVT